MTTAQRNKQEQRIEAAKKINDLIHKAKQCRQGLQMIRPASIDVRAADGTFIRLTHDLISIDRMHKIRALLEGELDTLIITKAYELQDL